MKKIAEIMKENTIWRMTVITIVIILCFLIFPFRVIRHYADYKSDSTSAIEVTDPVTMEEIVLQQFTPQYSTIDKMNIGAIVSGFHPDGRDRLFATIYDENFEIVYQEVLDFKDVLDRNGIEICPEMQFEIGATYYIGINVHFDAVNELRVTYKGATAEDSDNLGFLFYANEWIPDRVALASIYYEQPLSNKQMVFAIAGVLLGGVLLYLFGAVLFRKIARVPAFAKIISISAGIIGTAIVGTSFYFACIARIFSSVRLDVCIYAGACIIAEAILIFGCFYLYRRNKLLAADKINNIGLLKKCSTIIYLRLVSLVLTLWGCIRYIDNDGQWIQDEGRNLVIVFFGLFVLLTIKKENIRCLINRLTIAYLVLAVPSGIVYAVLTGEAEHALGNQLLLMLGFTIWGLLIIYTASIYVKMKKNPFASCGKVLGIALAVLGASMLIFSFGKIWTIMMVIMLVVFYAQDYSVSERREHVHIFENAVLIHFGIMAFMCLLVRPIWAYRFVRYPMWFYTVACTGMYLVLVEAVAISRLFAKMKRTGTVFKECVWEWILNGIVFGFLFLSIARTALTALAFMSLVVLIGGIIVYRPRVKQYFKTIGIAVCVLSMSVVLVYSLVRCIPSAIALPYQLGSYEDDVAEPRIGEKPNSNYYLSAEDMLKRFGERFGLEIVIPESMLENFGNVSEQELVQFLGGGEMDSSIERGNGNADVSNGRFDVFEEYLGHLKLYGHEYMNIDGDYEMMQAHAHNSFIQVAFDYGIIAGIAFVAICVGVIVISVIRIVKNKDRSDSIWMALLITVGFVGASLTELVYNINIPLCFGLFFVIMYAMRKTQDVV